MMPMSKALMVCGCFAEGLDCGFVEGNYFVETLAIDRNAALLHIIDLSGSHRVYDLDDVRVSDSRLEFLGPYGEVLLSLDVGA